MDHAGETVTMDARPSDAIALALRWDCPIYVSREVLENSKQAASAQHVNADEMRRWFGNLSGVSIGGHKSSGAGSFLYSSSIKPRSPFRTPRTSLCSDSNDSLFPS